MQQLVNRLTMLLKEFLNNSNKFKDQPVDQLEAIQDQHNKLMQDINDLISKLQEEFNRPFRKIDHSNTLTVF